MGSLRVSAFYLSILINSSILSDFFFYFFFLFVGFVLFLFLCSLTLVLCIFPILKFSRPADHASTGLATTAYYIDTVYQVEV